MRRIIAVMVIVALFTAVGGVQVAAAESAPNVQAVWMATVFNIDFPNTKNNVMAQKIEFIDKLDKLKAAGVNTIVVQVRPKADALYQSAMNPWSDVLTGIQGQHPLYDPLAFMIAEARQRGIAIQAWLNPYRVTTSGTDLSALCATHPARLHPDWVFSYNNALYYNPESAGVQRHIVSTVEEIIKDYDIDAIILDDYFYPSNYPLPQGESKDGPTAAKRRQNVNDMVSKVSAAVKSSAKNVSFGISPMGIWKNKASDPTGSETTGSQGYYTVHADARAWIKNGWIDFIVPQIYWETGHKAADYETLVKWWANEVRGTDVQLYIGQGIYRDVVANQIDTQLKINQKYPEVGGSFYYGMESLLNNTVDCRAKILAFNQTAAPGAGIVASRSSGASADTAQAAQREGTVTASILNIRNGGGLQYAVLAKVARGTKVTVLDAKTGWYNVRLANGQTGWASADYVVLH
ncbi:MAG: family 10 glycosylhydrolase [Clostridia bacterium]|jgi:uncharacterized lipoprotein YddW (UPF0748 family)|nr:family 10 glycosylhydrolase [Clostridia bacterium]